MSFIIIATKMTNISLGEVTELREFLSTAHNHLRAIERVAEPEEEPGTQESADQFTYSARDPRAATADADTRNRSTANTLPELDESLNSNNMDLF
jgi:hypothetical protein